MHRLQISSFNLFSESILWFTICLVVSRSARWMSAGDQAGGMEVELGWWVNLTDLKPARFHRTYWSGVLSRGTRVEGGGGQDQVDRTKTLSTLLIFSLSYTLWQDGWPAAARRSTDPRTCWADVHSERDRCCVTDGDTDGYYWLQLLIKAVALYSWMGRRWDAWCHESHSCTTQVISQHVGFSV